MSTEEKLQKCIEFIRSIERNNIIPKMHISAEDPRIDGDFQCDDCGSHAIIGSTYIGIPDELRDKAWHLLADIDGLCDR